MRRAFIFHLRQHVVGYLALFVALGGGGAYAATTLVGSDGTITGCVSKRTGALRVVKPGKKCPKGYRKLEFNQTGVRGESGAPGAPGAPGAKGERGSAIVARVRSGPVVIASSGETPVPLAGASWTQPTDELEQLVGVAWVTVNGGTSCGTIPNVTVTIRDNANQIGSAGVVASPVSAPGKINFALYPSLDNHALEPDAPATHALTATATTNCSGGTLTVDKVVVDVTGVR